MAGVSISGILGLSTWESWEKCHLGVALTENHKKYYKGEGGGFPKVRLMMNFVSPCMLLAYACTKSVPIIHYQFVVWFIQINMNN
jgi:hypothetical protein